MNGILIVNKGKDVTSRDVVNDLVHIFHTKKIGHTGTLDPLATGVLVCTIGKYTKLNLDLTQEYKEYIAEMQFGINTDTLDITGKVLNEEEYIIDEEKVTKAINSFKKEYMQEVPIYSSVKVNGRKLYDYARSGESVELPKKLVNIKEIEVLEINKNTVKFRCLVSKGTYIRSLIRDIAESLDTYATMTSLIRTKQGKFDIKDSYTIDEIKNNKYKMLSIEEVLDLDIVTTSDNLFKLINNGVAVDYKSNKEYILFRYNFEDIALYKKDTDNKYHMYIKYNE
jgi:tRNA pseudouridine55 synthase